MVEAEDLPRRKKYTAPEETGVLGRIRNNSHMKRPYTTYIKHIVHKFESK